MTLRPHRRNLVVWGPSAGPDGRYGGLPFIRLTRTGRIRRCLRLGALLAVIGLMRVAYAVRPRWRLLLAGTVLTVAGVMLRSGAGSVVLIPGLLFLLCAPLVEARPAADRKRRSELERELAVYSTPAQRRDLEATLDRYPDGITNELRDILASQAMATRSSRFPAAGRY